MKLELKGSSSHLLSPWLMSGMTRDLKARRGDYFT